MYTAQIENSGGETLVLTQDEANYQVISITGLNPPPAIINTTSIAGMDGAKFNSSKLNTRNIVIMLKINGDVETNRQLLYQFFRTKENCTFYFSNEHRNVSIKGYVETVEVNLFQNGETMQISMICPYPYFKDLAQIIIDISNEAAGFEFPFAINIGDPIPFSTYISNKITNVQNTSESETGVMIEIDVHDAVSKIQIKNTDTGDSMTLNYSFLADDKVLINTNKGQKNISLIREGTQTNIFSAMAQGSVFFQLQVGSNYFGYLVDNGTNDDAVTIYFKFSNIYRGV